MGDAVLGYGVVQVSVVPPQPGAGRIVHFVSSLGVRPAIVIGPSVAEGCVNLQQFTDGENDEAPGKEAPNTIWRCAVPYSEDGGIYSWHWPPRVP